MKKLTVLIALMFATSAMATEREDDDSGSNRNQSQSQTANGGNALISGVSASSAVNYNDERNPVSSAIAPNVNVGVDCPVITVGSHAAQLFFFGGSTTGIASVNPLCAAIKLNQPAVAQQILCNTNAEYKKAAKQVGITCFE